MKTSTILIVDVETSHTDPSAGELLEVAAAKYSISCGSMIWAQSWLCAAEENDAESINGIPPSLVSTWGLSESSVHKELSQIECDAVTSWNWAFDEQWLPSLAERPSFYSMDDIEWPRFCTSKALTHVAVAHGVGVMHAHRAMSDVMTMIYLFDRVAEMGHDLGSMVARAMRPKAIFEVADKRFDEARNALAKEHGFRWDPDSRSWRRSLAIEDAGSLPFAVRQAAR